MPVKNRFAVLFLICFPLVLFAQLDNFAIIKTSTPDFGAVNGSWGHLQFYRPFGVNAIILDDWKDLTGISPLTGEPFNTHRQGWLPLDSEASLWEQLHPTLTAPADTAAASTQVNYRQGDGEFKDFTLWYHNSLDKQTRYGWTSKLRSHPRVLDVTVYDQQRHRFQVNTVQNEQKFQIEAGYDHEVNPLYMISQDSLLVWYFDDVPQIHSTLWDGSFEWNNVDSNSIGTGLSVWVQGGVWNWSLGERRSLSSMAYLSHRFNLFSLRPIGIKVGAISKQFGSDKRVQQLTELNFPTWVGDNYLVELGLKSLGKAPLFPMINMQYELGVFQLGFKTYQLIEERIWDPKMSQIGIQELSATLNLSRFNLSLSTWSGEDDGNQLSGFSGQTHFQFPWQMDGMMGAALVNKPSDWVFSEKYINWELTQRITLFEDALHTRLKIWGRHLFNTQLGILDDHNFQTSNSVYLGEEVLHLVNYTISGQASSLIVSFTDENMLQDDLWSQYASIPWNQEFSIMTNQIPNSRFRYLSIIWTFEN